MSVTQAIVDTLTWAARYWFVFLLAFIVLRLSLNVYKEYRLDRSARGRIEKASIVGHLVWMAGDPKSGASQIYWLPFAKEAVVGSARTCDVRIEDRSIAREHAQTSYQDGVLYIKRIGAAPISVGERVCPPDGYLDVHDGETLKLGDVALVLTLDGGMA